MRNIFILFIITNLFLYSNNAFSNKDFTVNETACWTYDNSKANKENCNNINVNTTKIFNSCCFVSYYNKTSKTNYTKCAVIENTEFGLNLYKHELSRFSKVKIICSGSYEKINYIYILLLTLFF
jgi:hypothetical protein